MLLLCCWHLSIQLPQGDKGIQVLEMYAGQARISRLGTAIGLSCSAHDVTYDVGKGIEESAMNINGEAGFASTSQSSVRMAVILWVLFSSFNWYSDARA